MNSFIEASKYYTSTGDRWKGEKMAKPIVKVGINGYGVIGKRCADAISLQDDMKLVGISDIASDYRIKLAQLKGYPIYCSLPEKEEEMRKAGIEVVGTLEDMLKEVDVIIDCTPKGIGAKNKALYDKHGVKSIFQGGESHELTGLSFVAQCNYKEALGKDSLRVVSCNTTGICRVIGSLHKKLGIKMARVMLARRACDPWESHKGGVINTFYPEAHIPSHQGPDAQTVIPDLPIITIAAKGPYNISHMHFAFVEFREKVDRETVISVLDEAPRIIFVNAGDGIEALNSVLEICRDLQRPRADLWEVAVWKDILALNEDCTEAYLIYQVHNEAIVIPENIDAIRALTELETDPMKSIEKTDKSLGIVKKLL